MTPNPIPANLDDMSLPVAFSDTPSAGARSSVTVRLWAWCPATTFSVASPVLTMRLL